MLKLTGNVGKSIIVDAIKKYNNARLHFKKVVKVFDKMG